MPRLSIQPSEPPPAPIAEMSRIGRLVPKGPIRARDWVIGSPWKITELSKLVPPISAVIKFASPTVRPRKPELTIPPAGPETASVIGRVRASSADIEPPFDCITKKLPVNPAWRKRDSTRSM
jgi:hypothetical protein